MIYMFQKSAIICHLVICQFNTKHWSDWFINSTFKAEIYNVKCSWFLSNVHGSLRLLKLHGKLFIQSKEIRVDCMYTLPGTIW